MAVRVDRDITNQDVAEALGVDAATVGRWFLGKSYPADDALERLAAFFGVTPAWLRYGQGPRDAPYQPMVDPVSERLTTPPGAVRAHPMTKRAGGRGR